MAFGIKTESLSDTISNFRVPIIPLFVGVVKNRNNCAILRFLRCTVLVTTVFASVAMGQKPVWASPTEDEAIKMCDKLAASI